MPDVTIDGTRSAASVPVADAEGGSGRGAVYLTLPQSPLRKFFRGIPWLDSNVAYFRRLGEIQRRRTHADMVCWGDGKRQQCALTAGQIFMCGAHWPTAYFFPADSWKVMWMGPEPFFWRAMDSDLDILRELRFWLRACGMVTTQRELHLFLRRETFGEFIDTVTAAIPLA